MIPMLDFFVDANVLLLLAYILWRGAQALILRSPLRQDHGFQVALLKAVLLVTLLSPLLAQAALAIGHKLAPGTPTTLSDMAVAAYLKGNIALPAQDFEALLNTRGTWTEALLRGDLSWAVALAMGLAAVGLFHLGQLALSILRVQRAVSDSYLWRRTARVDIRLSDTVRVPFAARGLWRRHVVLPSNLVMQPAELRLILAHEFQHLRARDVEWELAFEALRPLLFWNPAFVLWKRAFDQLRELSCDQTVLAGRRIDPHTYAACLLDFCERRIRGPWPKSVNVAFVSAPRARWGRDGARAALEQRILALYVVPSARRLRGLIPGCVLVLTLCITLAAASVRQPGDWSQDRLMLSTIVNLERLEAITRAHAAPFGGTTIAAQTSQF